MNKKIIKKEKEIKKITENFSQIGICLGCLKGRLVKRSGKYGFFWGCSRFPKCGYVKKMNDSDIEETKRQINLNL